MNAQESITAFLRGEVDIVTFRKLYDENPEINDFLQGIVDEKKRTGEAFLRFNVRVADIVRETDCNVSWLVRPQEYPGVRYGNSPYDSVRKMLTYEAAAKTHNVASIKGARAFYDEVYALHYQVDQSIPYDERYKAACELLLDVVPEHLEGVESEQYICNHILPLYPDTMKKSTRIKAIKAAIKEAFRSDKGRPQWLQSGEWPLGKDGKPAVYTGSKSVHGGEGKQYYFRDESDGSVITVEQSH